MRYPIKKIISGGQTGVDRAALDWAIQHSIPHGGWCPKGRLASDGIIHERYMLQETESSGYRQRTKRNVADADATVVFNIGDLDGGTLQTVKFAMTQRKPFVVIQLDDLPLSESVELFSSWVETNKIMSLNFAGPREEKRPGVYVLVGSFLDTARDIHDWHL